ncbi:MAG: general stress protein [Rubrivivax sp.]|nr:MAG: general stress protein [Rubrivivax sp.]
MDSINRQQPEHNHEDLAGQAAIDRLKDVVKKTQNCFFHTRAGQGPSAGTRPMNVRKVDDAGHLWFLSAIDSHKNAELSTESSVDLFFQGSEHSDFLHLVGRATISRDPARIDDLWEPILKTWFTEGKDDPRITVIEVTPVDGYYWDNKHGNVVAGAKMLLGAAIGKTLDDSIEGRLTP